MRCVSMIHSLLKVQYINELLARRNSMKKRRKKVGF